MKTCRHWLTAQKSLEFINFKILKNYELTNNLKEWFKMKDFTFQWPTKVIFGKNAEEKIGEEIKRYGKKVLLHYGSSGFIKNSGLHSKLVKLLEKEKRKVIEIGGVVANPLLGLVKEGIKICRKENIDFILAVGGGSVIDSAKAIAIGVPYNGDVWDFYLNKAEVNSALPIGVISTFPAAGSEGSNGSVITNKDTGYKLAVVNELLRPKFAILNPELTYTLPPYQTACGVADIMSHVMERYFTSVSNVDLTDRLCEATLKTVIKNAPLVLKDPENYEARAEIMWAAVIAHNDLLSTGRTGDWGSHMIGMELSAIYNTTHGATLSVITPAWMKYVYKNNLNRFAQFAERVWNTNVDFNNPEKTALEGIKRLSDFFKELGLPLTLKELNIPDDRFGEMAAKYEETGVVGSIMELKKEDVVNILKLAK